MVAERGRTVNERAHPGEATWRARGPADGLPGREASTTVSPGRKGPW
jgi:hypothetical protein